MSDDIKKIQKYINSYYENYYRINYVYYEWAIENGIQDTTLFVLDQIFELQDHCTQRQVTENLGYPKQTVSFIMNKLEKQGIIYREKLPSDKRSYIVKFTKEGKKFAESILTVMRNAEIEAYQGMTEEERKMVTLGLQILADKLETSFKKNKSTAKL